MQAILRALTPTLAACLLSGCTLSAALRHDEIRSVWGPGRALPPHPVFFATDRTPEGLGFALSWGGVPHCGRATVRIANALSQAAPDPALEAISAKPPRRHGGLRQDRSLPSRAAATASWVLIVIHGFNLTFRDQPAAWGADRHGRSGAALALLLNWSSEGMFNGYARPISSAAPMPCRCRSIWCGPGMRRRARSPIYWALRMGRASP